MGADGEGALDGVGLVQLGQDDVLGSEHDAVLAAEGDDGAGGNESGGKEKHHKEQM